MAQVFSRDNFWWIDYRDPHGRRKRKKISPDKKTAQAVLNKILTSIAEKKYLDKDEDSQKLSFSEFADQYLKIHSKVENKSWRDDEKRLKVLKEEFGSRSLGSIKTDDIVQFKSKLLSREKAPGKTIRPATVNRYLMLLQGLFSRAIEWGNYTQQHPCKSVKILKENNQKERFLSGEEIQKLLSECYDELKDVVEFDLCTGMRAGELLGLKWSDIDFKLGLIFIRRSGKAAYSPKSGKNRAVPMTTYSKNILMRLSENRENEFVFQSRHWDAYKAAVERAGLNPEGTHNLDKVVFHTLRHTFASQLAIQGVDLYRIAKLIGDSLQVVEKRYAHLQPKHLQEVRLIDNVWTQNQARMVESADTSDLKSDGLLKGHASSNLASGSNSHGHYSGTEITCIENPSIQSE